MKLFFISDIHGSAHSLEKALSAFEKEGAEQILILGDQLYHGPRNPLPEGYNSQKVCEMLNQRKDIITAVRGNCDSEVDQMMLDYPIMSDYSVIFTDNRKFFFTHGHLFNPDSLPPLKKGDIFVYGHVHLPIAEKRDDLFIFNPGSISLPKENNPNSYGVYYQNKLSVKTLEGVVIKEVDLLI